MSGSPGLTDEEAREAGELARRLLELRSRSPPRVERHQRTGKFDPRSAMRADRDPDGGDRIFKRSVQEPSPAKLSVLRVVMESLRLFSQRSIVPVRPREEPMANGHRVREFVWALHRRAGLRARLLEGTEAFVVVQGPEDSWHLLRVPSASWVKFVDEFCDLIGVRVLSEEALEELNGMIRREAFRNSVRSSPVVVERAAGTFRHRSEPAIWDESAIEIAR